MRRRRFRPFRLGLWLGVIAGAVWFLQRYLQREAASRAPSAAPAPTPMPAPPVRPSVPIVAPDVVEVGDLDRPGEPEVATMDIPPGPAKKPPAKKAAAKKAAAPKRAAPPLAATTWVSPDGGVCPTSHPVKAKLSSKVFHLPGMLAYDRTKPDRCYADEAAAEADGLRKAKR